MRIILFLSLLICNELLAQPFYLPTLKFNYSAYEPYIDAKTMEIHHSKHHQGYVNKLNKAIQGNKYEQMDLRSILLNASHLPDNVKNNSGGHYNHSLFWDILNPVKRNETPSNELKIAIKNSFGSMDSLKMILGTAAAKQFGSGWAWLIVTPDKKLAVSSTSNQDNPIMDISSIRGIPIIGIDVWEHAYYLKYQNKRKDYLENIWSLLDWKIISNKYVEACNDSFLDRIRDDSWKEMKSFHLSFLKTKDAIEKSTKISDLSLMSSNLYANSVILVDSQRPEKFNSNEISKILNSIKRYCESLDKCIKSEKSRKTLLSKIYNIQEKVDFIKKMR